MNRRERKKQQKKKDRQERLRREKHVRPSPHAADEDELEDTDVASPEDVSEPAPVGAAAGDHRVSADGPLDNFFKGEPAQKWLDALLAGTDVDPIVRTLDPAEYVPGDLLLKASVCCEILVAAELVATGIGRPSRHLPAPVAAWLHEQDVFFSPGVVMLAAKAVRRVGDFSELRHLWDVVQLGSEWLQGVEALHGRLQGWPEEGGDPPGFRDHATLLTVVGRVRLRHQGPDQPEVPSE